MQQKLRNDLLTLPGELGVVISEYLDSPKDRYSWFASNRSANRERLRRKLLDPDFKEKQILRFGPTLYHSLNLDRFNIDQFINEIHAHYAKIKTHVEDLKILLDLGDAPLTKRYFNLIPTFYIYPVLVAFRQSSLTHSPLHTLLLRYCLNMPPKRQEEVVLYLANQEIWSSDVFNKENIALALNSLPINNLKKLFAKCPSDIVLKESFNAAIVLRDKQPSDKLPSAVKTEPTKLELIQAAEKNPSVVFEQYHHLKSSQYFIAQVVSLNSLAIQFISDDLKRDVNFVKKLVRSNPSAYTFLDEDIKLHDEIAAIVMASSSGINFINDFIGNKHYLKRLLSYEGLALRHASFELKSDYDIVLAAVDNNPLALEHAAPKLKSDFTVVKMAVAKNGETLKFASPLLQDNADVVMTAIKSFPLALQYASTRLRSQQDIVSDAVMRNENAIQYSLVPKLNKKVIVPVLQKRGELLEYAGLHRENKGVVLAAVKSCGKAIQFASNRLRRNTDVIKSALINDLDAYRFVDTSFFQKPANMLFVLRLWKKNKSSAVYDLIPVKLRENPEFMKNAIRENGYIWMRMYRGNYEDYSFLFLSLEQCVGLLPYATAEVKEAITGILSKDLEIGLSEKIIDIARDYNASNVKASRTCRIS